MIAFMPPCLVICSIPALHKNKVFFSNILHNCMGDWPLYAIEMAIEKYMIVMWLNNHRTTQCNFNIMVE